MPPAKHYRTSSVKQVVPVSYYIKVSILIFLLVLTYLFMINWYNDTIHTQFV
jgi:hypothetical protein